MMDSQEEPVTDLAVRPQAVLIGVDAELLEEAQRHISAPSAGAAVAEALERLVERERARRHAAGEHAARMVESDEVTFRPLGSVDQ